MINCWASFGRDGEVANGRFIDFRYAEIGLAERRLWSKLTGSKGSKGWVALFGMRPLRFSAPVFSLGELKWQQRHVKLSLNQLAPTDRCGRGV